MNTMDSNIKLEITDIIEPDTFTLRDRLLRFYHKNCPEKITNIDNIVKKYNNKEKELFKSLTSKYGKEPPLTMNEKNIINNRLKLQKDIIEKKNENLNKLKIEKMKKKNDYLDINTYPYDKNTLDLLQKIDGFKGKELPAQILAQI